LVADKEKSFLYLVLMASILVNNLVHLKQNLVRLASSLTLHYEQGDKIIYIY
jgi:hypothetical protein